ncbi:MAG: protein kinase [Planctomycetaceae bacterium]
MKISNFELLSQVRVSPAGVRYRVTTAAHSGELELQLLRRTADSGVLWDHLMRRIRRVRLVDHPCVVPIVELNTDHDPPFLVVRCGADGSRPGAVIERPLQSFAESVRKACQLADALATAHRVGVAHGMLSADNAIAEVDGNIRIDLTAFIPTVDAPSAEFSSDILACGQLLRKWFSEAQPDVSHATDARARDAASSGASADLLEFIDRMTDDDASRRPRMSEVAERLEHEAECLFGDTAAAPPCAEGTVPTAMRSTGTDTFVPAAAAVGREPEVGDRLGRFRLLELLGRGGMGSVFRAQDEADGTPVAVKIIRPDIARRPDALARFRREARVLEQLNNPFVTNLLEFNEDGGVPYLVMEFVAGRSLQRELKERGKLPETTAAAIMADVCRALRDAHRRGIVHRDIKPDNILLQDVEPSEQPSWRVKLSDFGIARRQEDVDATRLTQIGSAIGTPLYMAPEQNEDGASADARSDVYSVGATLFHLLAGRPPFAARSMASLIRMHAEEPPPYLKTLDEQLSDSICNVVDRSLAKQPDQRFASAGELLKALESFLSGDAAGEQQHPPSPAGPTDNVMTYHWTWNLAASPEELWPYVSNTDRFNRAVGLPVVRYTDTQDDRGRARRLGEFSRFGMKIEWHERPFEWVEPRRFGVFREYSRGPFRWITSVVELNAHGTGTRLSQTIRICPSGIVGRMLAALEIGIRAPGKIAAVYQRIDQAVAGKGVYSVASQAFEPAASLTRAQWRRLEARLQQLRDAGVSSSTVHEFGDYLTEASPQEVARIRPVALARGMKVDEDELLSACLHGTHGGLLTLAWDVLCPVCRISAGVRDTLQAVRDHEFCPACDLQFEVDPARSIELVFRVDESIRPVEVRTYCIGGPAHLPHVAAQLTLHANERLSLTVNLPAGTYAIRGPGTEAADHIDVFTGAPADAGTWRRSQHGRNPRMELKPAVQSLTLHNDQADEAIVRIERTALRDDAVLAAQVLTMPLFRQLFPTEVFSPDALCTIKDITVLAMSSRNTGDCHAIAEIVTDNNGVVFDAPTGELTAVFHEPVAAVRTAISWTRNRSTAADDQSRIAIHRAPAAIRSDAGRLHYQGEAVGTATLLSQQAEPGTPLITGPVTSEPDVAALIAEHSLQLDVAPAELSDRPELLIHLLHSAWERVKR